MAPQMVIDSNDWLMGVDVASEGDTGSPGSGGASPYLRRSFPATCPVQEQRRQFNWSHLTIAANSGSTTVTAQKEEKKEKE
jgi:hypothetical protein